MHFWSAAYSFWWIPWPYVVLKVSFIWTNCDTVEISRISFLVEGVITLLLEHEQVDPIYCINYIPLKRTTFSNITYYMIHNLRGTILNNLSIWICIYQPYRSKLYRFRWPIMCKWTLTIKMSIWGVLVELGETVAMVTQKLKTIRIEEDMGVIKPIVVDNFTIIKYS